MIMHDWYSYSNLYSYDECMELLKLSETKKSQHLVDQGPDFKKVSSYVIETKHMGSILDKFFDCIIETNQRVFGFDLWPRLPVGVNINSYQGEKNEYPWHRDANQYGSPGDIKLTAVLNITPQQYAGGEFELRLNDPVVVEEINFTGNLLIFPSFYWHRVNPVTKGERITLSAWFEGPAFK